MTDAHCFRGSQPVIPIYLSWNRNKDSEILDIIVRKEHSCRPTGNHEIVQFPDVPICLDMWHSCGLWTMFQTFGHQEVLYDGFHNIWDYTKLSQIENLTSIFLNHHLSSLPISTAAMAKCSIL